MYPTKVYTIDGVLIYQTDNGGDNTNRSPLGGVIVSGSVASSMLDAIANPITYYGNPVVNQEGYSSDLYNYYWTSYSRGVDGRTNTTSWINELSWHNAYLDGYIPLRVKSIYDPCPYLYRIPSNGTYNQLSNSYQKWTHGSYLGGVSWDLTTLGKSLIPGLGYRNAGSAILNSTGVESGLRLATIAINGVAYISWISDGSYFQNDIRSFSHSNSVRCIEVTRRYAHTFCQQKVCKNCRAS